ncbi:MAG: cell division protein FtsZ [Chthoniobacteraceae bacterium]
MITLTRPNAQAAPVIKVLGLGGAGGNALDRLILDGLEGAATIALNTDVQSLNGSVSPQKIHLGKTTTRGLGAGGDPEIGYEAADEAEEEIRAALEGTDLIFLCAGLGGGTGSGAAPLVAHMARNAGALVIAFVTMPFSFEGKRRRIQAAEALAQLEEQADLVICFENDRMGEAVAPTSGIQQAFVAADQTLSQAIRSTAAMLRRGGLINVGLDELASAIRRHRAQCLFGYGESDSANRAHEALQRALKNPLMDKGRMLADTQAVLVHVAGGPDLTLNEVSVLMDEFSRHVSDTTRVHFGVATDPKLGRRLCVTVISSIGAAASPAAPAARPVVIRQAAPAAYEEPAPIGTADLDEEIELALPVSPREPEPSPVLVPKNRSTPAPQSPQPARKTVPDKAAAAAAKKEEKAEQMTLEPANRGRFEKSEPTIVDGQDLDVPTFLRKNLKVK